MNMMRREICNYILQRISSGELKEGERLPTEQELANIFDTNRMNAHFAVKELENNGIVSRNKKQGTLVRKQLDDASIEELQVSSSNKVYVFATSAYSRNIHWNEGTISELETLLNKNGYKAYHYDMPKSQKEFEAQIDKLSEIKANSIVLLPERGDIKVILESLGAFEKFSGEIFLLNRGEGPLWEFPYHTLNVNPFGEGEIVARHIISQGFKRVVFLDKKNRIEPEPFWAVQRYEGLKRGMMLASSDALKPELFQNPDLKTYPGVLEIIRKHSDEKIVFVARNDEIAVSFLEYARLDGMDAPRDFYLIGFDNNPFFRNCNITSVAPPIEKMGQVLAEMICFPKWRKKDGLQLTIKLDSHIIRRETC